MTRGLLAAVALACAGCSVPFGDAPNEQQVNKCGPSDECGGDGVCVNDVCVATSVDLPGLVVEVRPHADAAFGATTSFFFKPGDGFQSADLQGVSAGFSPTLPAPVAIEGGQVLPFENKSNCETVNAALTFYEAPQFWGLPVNVPAKVTTTFGMKGFSFDADLEPATYDVYVEPIAVEGCATPPPAFFPAQVIGATTEGFTRTLPQPSKLTGTIVVPLSAPGSIGSWVVDIVERKRGARVSTTQQLVQQGVVFTVAVDLDFTWREEDDPPLLRLSPPEGTPGPTVYWDLSAVGGSMHNPVVSLSIQDLLIKPRTVKPFIMHGSSVVSAAVTIQSIELLGEVAKNATFSLDVPKTDADGSLPVELPPGTYAVRVFPFDLELPVTESTITVPPLKDGEKEDACVCGMVIQVGDKALLQGSAKTPLGEPLLGVTVNTIPSLTGAITFLRDQHFLSTQSARTASTTTNAEGGFLLEIDHGFSDLTVQPAASSGFPWLVSPRIRIDGDAQLNNPLVLTNPAFLGGRIVDPMGRPVSNADVNAWLPLPDVEGGGTSTVLQIAATATNDEGGYTLALPASITH